VQQSRVAPELHGVLKLGMYLIGDVNIGASDEDELYFHKLDKIAPEPSKALA